MNVPVRLTHQAKSFHTDVRVWSHRLLGPTWVCTASAPRRERKGCREACTAMATAACISRLAPPPCMLKLADSATTFAEVLRMLRMSGNAFTSRFCKRRRPAASAAVDAPRSPLPRSQACDDIAGRAREKAFRIEFLGAGGVGAVLGRVKGPFWACSRSTPGPRLQHAKMFCLTAAAAAAGSKPRSARLCASMPGLTSHPAPAPARRRAGGWSSTATRHRRRPPRHAACC